MITAMMSVLLVLGSTGRGVALQSRQGPRECSVCADESRKSRSRSSGCNPAGAGWAPEGREGLAGVRLEEPSRGRGCPGGGRSARRLRPGPAGGRRVAGEDAALPADRSRGGGQGGEMRSEPAGGACARKAAQGDRQVVRGRLRDLRTGRARDDLGGRWRARCLFPWSPADRPCPLESPVEPLPPTTLEVPASPDAGSPFTPGPGRLCRHPLCRHRCRRRPTEPDPTPSLDPAPASPLESPSLVPSGRLETALMPAWPRSLQLVLHAEGLVLDLFGHRAACPSGPRRRGPGPAR